MSRKLLLALTFLVVLGIAVVVMAATYELFLLFNSWLEGKPLGIVKISVETPKADGICFIAVHRFFTPINPTKAWNQTDVIYRGKVKCGESVVVKDTIRMMQVGAREVNGEVMPIYDSPEYAVVVVSKSGGFNRIIQTDIVKPITEVKVKAEFESGESASPAEAPSTSRTCKISSNPDACVLDVKLAYINSIPGLKTAFGLEGVRPSTMHIEGWGSSCISSEPDTPCPPSAWRSGGKKLTISNVGEISDYVSDGQRAIVWGGVEYLYERHAVWDDEFEAYWKYEFFYPRAIGGLSPPQVVGSYTPPPTPPSYAAGPQNGSCEINFEKPYPSDTKLNLTAQAVLNIGELSFSISISPYQSGDDRHPTPYLSIVDVSGKGYPWYYWWYKNNDRMTYEVEFYGS